MPSAPGNPIQPPPHDSTPHDSTPHDSIDADTSTTNPPYTTPAPYGTVIGSFNGIDAMSNGNGNTDSIGAYGLTYECVEYVNRYYGEKLKYHGDHCGTLGLGNMLECGNGVDYYPNASEIGLNAYPNGGTVPPKAEDIVSFSGGSRRDSYCPNGCGHVSIVKAVFADHIRVIQENWNNDSSDANFRINMTVENGHYTLQDMPNGYHAQGWLRIPSSQ